MPFLASILAFTPLVLLTILLCVQIRGRAYKDCPWFVAYVAFAVTADTVRFLVRHSRNPYFYVYWVTEAGYAALGVLVFYEVFRAAFRDLIRILWVRLIFPVTVAAAISLAIARSHTEPSHMPNPLMTWIITAELGVRLLQVSVFVLLVILVQFFGLRWRQYAFGIAAGFGSYATVALLATTKFSEFGTRFAFTWGTLLLLSYSIAVLIWIWFFSRPQPPEQSGEEQDFPTPSLQELERYKRIARRMWRR